MDDIRFDALTRALGGAASRRGALGALLGLGLVGAAGHDATAKKKRKRCDPACAAGQTCDQGACRCDNGGTVCGVHCCLLGQRCENGTCVAEPARCVAAGEACKGTGRPCCDGTVCASGQGGQDDVACWSPAGGACETTADCVYDATCRDGACVANEHPVDGGGVTGPYDVCASGCRWTTLAEAVAAAAPGSTITVGPGVFEACNLDIDKNLTIEGQGAGPLPPLATVPDISGSPTAPTQGDPPVPPPPPAGYDPLAANAAGTTIRCLAASDLGRRGRGARAGSVSRIARVRPTGVLSLSRVLLYGGRAGGAGADGEGGLIRNEGTLGASDAAFVYGEAAVGGGLIANAAGATLTAVSSVFMYGVAGTDPSQPADGGAIHNQGQVTLGGTSAAPVVFTWNEAGVGSGGAVYNAAGSTAVTGNATFLENYAGVSGGAAAVYDGTLRFSGANELAGNVAGRWVAGIVNAVTGAGGAIAVIGAPFGTRAPEATLGGSTVVRGNRSNDGGGINVVRPGSLTLEGQALVSGNAAWRKGGGVADVTSGSQQTPFPSATAANVKDNVVSPSATCPQYGLYWNSGINQGCATLT